MTNQRPDHYSSQHRCSHFHTLNYVPGHYGWTGAFQFPILGHLSQAYEPCASGPIKQSSNQSWDKIQTRTKAFKVKWQLCKLLRCAEVFELIFFHNHTVISYT